jgi:hypothetical protein
MKTLLLAVLLCTTIFAAVPALPQNAFSPDQIKFGPAPPVPPLRSASALSRRTSAF